MGALLRMKVVLALLVARAAQKPAFYLLQAGLKVLVYMIRDLAVWITSQTIAIDDCHKKIADSIWVNARHTQPITGSCMLQMAC